MNKDNNILLEIDKNDLHVVLNILKVISDKKEKLLFKLAKLDAKNIFSYFIGPVLGFFLLLGLLDNSIILAITSLSISLGYSFIYNPIRYNVKNNILEAQISYLNNFSDDIKLVLKKRQELEQELLEKNKKIDSNDVEFNQIEVESRTLKEKEELNYVLNIIKYYGINKNAFIQHLENDTLLDYILSFGVDYYTARNLYSFINKSFYGNSVENIDNKDKKNIEYVKK